MVEKDTEKAQRLNEVYKHLYAHNKVKSQKDFAEVLGVQRTGLSAALNGSKINLTKNLFMKICATYPGIFNIQYLWNGEGSLLMNEQPTPASKEKEDAACLIELAAKLIKEVEALRHELQEELAEVRALRQQQVKEYQVPDYPSSILHVAEPQKCLKKKCK